MRNHVLLDVIILSVYWASSDIVVTSVARLRTGNDEDYEDEHNRSSLEELWAMTTRECGERTVYWRQSDTHGLTHPGTWTETEARSLVDHPWSRIRSMATGTQSSSKKCWRRCVTRKNSSTPPPWELKHPGNWDMVAFKLLWQGTDLYCCRSCLVILDLIWGESVGRRRWPGPGAGARSAALTVT